MSVLDVVGSVRLHHPEHVLVHPMSLVHGYGLVGFVNGHVQPAGAFN